MKKIVKIVNISKNDLPKYETDFSSGMDLKASLCDPITLKPLQRAIISTGIFIELPNQHEAQIRHRSGLAINKGISVLNTPGTIDSDYRGEVKVILINLSNKDYVVNSGDRIAQLVVSKYEHIEWSKVNSLNDTDRGDGGFGHTGN